MLPPPPSPVLVNDKNTSAAAAQVVQAVSATIATSVATSLGTSIAIGSTGGSAHVSLPLIHIIQMMDIHKNIYGMDSAPNTNSLMTSTPWASGSFGKSPLHRRRSLLENEDIMVDKAWTKLFWIGVVVIPIAIGHALWFRIKKIQKDGILGYPQFQITLFGIVVLPVVDAIAILLSSGNPAYIAGALLIGLGGPVPWIAYQFYFLRKYSVISKDVCYHDKKKEWVVTRHESGHWIRAHSVLYQKRMGHKQIIKPVFAVNPSTKKFERYRVDDGSNTKSTSFIQTYIVPLTLVKKSVITILLHLLRRYHLPQLVTCLSIVSINTLVYLTTPVYSYLAYHISDTVAALSELSLYLLALLSHALGTSLDMGMFICQLAIVIITILTNMGSSLWMIYMLIRTRRQKKAVSKLANVAIQCRDLRGKYANRWLWIVHQRTLQGWPQPNIPSRKVHITVDTSDETSHGKQRRVMFHLNGHDSESM